jgi:hypothetical protein
MKLHNSFLAFGAVQFASAAYLPFGEAAWEADVLKALVDRPDLLTPGGLFPVLPHLYRN